MTVGFTIILFLSFLFVLMEPCQLAIGVVANIKIAIFDLETNSGMRIIHLRMTLCSLRRVV